MKNHMFKLFGFVLFLLSFGTYANSNPIQVTVKLDNIAVEKTSEKSGDELYFSLTEYSSLGTSKTSRIPEYPTHWLSQHIPNLKAITLWEGPIQEGEEIRLILSLGEQDNPPWDPDDLLGSAQLTLTNKGGTLEKEWALPIFEEEEEAEMLSPSKTSPQGYIFKGEGSRYTVNFSVEQK